MYNPTGEGRANRGLKITVLVTYGVVFLFVRAYLKSVYCDVSTAVFGKYRYSLKKNYPQNPIKVITENKGFHN